MTLANTSNKRNFDLWYVWNGPIFKWGSPLLFCHIFLNIARIFTKFEMYAQKWLLLSSKASLVQQLDSTPICKRYSVCHVLTINCPNIAYKGMTGRNNAPNNCLMSYKEVWLCKNWNPIFKFYLHRCHKID